jgi:hypothetical protein
MKENDMPRLHSSRLRVALVAMSFLTVLQVRAEAASQSASPAARGEPPGSDVFVMLREALLRDKASKESRFVAKLPGGSRLKLIEPGEAYLKVEVLSGTSPGGDPVRTSRKGAAVGWLSRDAASIFAPDSEGTSDLFAAGRALVPSEGHRRLAAAFLLCASERLRSAGPGDPALEVLLGETAEALAASGGPFPPGLEVVRRGSSAGTEPASWIYAGDAFRRALALTAKAEEGDDAARLKERAKAGTLRQQYAEPSAALTTLWQETAGWLELVESARDATALRGASERLGSASLSLGRLLLAAGRLEDLDKVEKRVRGAGERVRALGASERPGAKLLARAQILRLMRGNGPASFPQETRATLGPKSLSVRIEGKLGSLELVEESLVGGTRVGPRRKTAVPVLPVPGSLRLSPDGRAVAWIEVVSPSKLVPVVASLERDEPAREIALLSSGRPLRDQGLAHVVSSFSGWSKDGQRLGLSIQAWNDTPGPQARYSVVSVTTGELLFETSRDLKSFQRLIE